MKAILEISKDEDKNTVAAILFANGYTVKKTKVTINNKSKYVVEATKDE
jgi:hypothetical protein